MEIEINGHHILVLQLEEDCLQFSNSMASTSEVNCTDAQKTKNLSEIESEEPILGTSSKFNISDSLQPLLFNQINTTSSFNVNINNIAINYEREMLSENVSDIIMDCDENLPNVTVIIPMSTEVTNDNDISVITIDQAEVEANCNKFFPVACIDNSSNVASTPPKTTLPADLSDTNDQHNKANTENASIAAHDAAADLNATNEQHSKSNADSDSCSESSLSDLDDSDYICEDEVNNLSVKSSNHVQKRRKGNFACDVEGCNRKFSRPDRLEQHSRIHTGARPYVCPESGCGRSYTRSQHLRRHQQVSHGSSDQPQHHTASGDTNTCETCRKQFSSVYSLRKHKSHYHSIRKYSCDQCGILFLKQQHLRTHYQQHTKVNPYRCDAPDCQESFINPSKLKRHKQVHMQGRYRCTRNDTCKQVFDRYVDLRRHVKRDHPYKCEDCGVEFEQLNRYNTHRRTHDDLRLTFHCTMSGCGRCYYSLRSLTSHVTDKHDGAGVTYPCKHCKAVFSTKQKMQQHHQKTHSPGHVRKQASSKAAPRTTRRDKGVSRTDYRKLLAGLPATQQSKNEASAPAAAGEATVDGAGNVRCHNIADNDGGTAREGGLQLEEREAVFDQVVGTRRRLEGTAVCRMDAVHCSAFNGSESRLKVSESNKFTSGSETAGDSSVVSSEKIGNIFISGEGAVRESRVVLKKISNRVVHMLSNVNLEE